MLDENSYIAFCSLIIFLFFRCHHQADGGKETVFDVDENQNFVRNFKTRYKKSLLCAFLS